MKVSIIIPCYNGEDYLEDCLESVCDQEFDNLEIIVVNDGSTDNSSKILLEWNSRKKRKATIIETENIGGGAARNLGLNQATGTYIQFLDVDDLLMPDKISHQVSLVTSAEIMPSIIAGGYKTLFQDGTETIHLPSEGDPWIGLIGSNLGITSANLFLNSALKRTGGFNKVLKSSQEYELMFRLMKQVGCLVTTDPEIKTIKREINPAAISKKSEGENAVRFIQLRESIKRYLVEEKLYTPEIDGKWCQTVFHAIKLLYDYDPKLSNKLFKQLLSDEFIPELSGAVSERYKFFFNFLGFGFTQKLYSLKRGILNAN